MNSLTRQTALSLTISSMFGPRTPLRACSSPGLLMANRPAVSMSDLRIQTSAFEPFLLDLSILEPRDMPAPWSAKPYSPAWSSHPLLESGKTPLGTDFLGTELSAALTEQVAALWAEKLMSLSQAPSLLAWQDALHYGSGVAMLEDGTFKHIKFKEFWK